MLHCFINLNSMGTTRIELRKDTADPKTGLCHLQLIYSLVGSRRKYKTGLKTWPETWDPKEQRVMFLNKAEAKKKLPKIGPDELPAKKDVDDMNAELMALKKDIADIEKRFNLDRTNYDADQVIEQLKQRRAPLVKKAGDVNEVYFYIDQYIAEHSSTRKKGSLAVYKSLRAHLDEFEKATGKRIKFAGIDYNFFNKFQNFLLTPHRVFVPTRSKAKPGGGRWKTVTLNNTTVAKQLSTLKTFINYARKEGVQVNDKYKDFPIKKEKLDVIALTQDEFDKLFDLDLSGNKKLAQVRDVFCFSCVTGLRYSDLNQLSRVHIHEDEIRLNIQKTSENLTIPLNPYSLAILEKYKEHFRPLPVISNPKMNAYLKELCKKAGIVADVPKVRFNGAKRIETVHPKYELITVHVGRKTFVTLSLERGMSAEEVMTITGHQDYQSFKRYVKITEQRKKHVMKKAWQMPEPKLKAV